MARKTGTIDFDGRTIRLLVSRGNEVLHWASSSVSGELMNQGLIDKPEGMAVQLTNLMGSNGFPKRRIVTSVTAHRTSSRVISLPKVKSKFLHEAVWRKAKQEMPLPMDETYLSWQLIGEDDNRLLVYAFAVPRAVIDRQVDTLRAAKLKPRAMELKPLALARAVNLPNAIIVNLEDQSLGVVLVVDGSPEIMRSVPQLAEDLEPGERVERLSQELTRTLQFYDEGHRSSPLDPNTKIYATGLLLETEEMRHRLAERTSFPVELPSPPMILPPEFPLATFSANLGLAIKRL